LDWELGRIKVFLIAGRIEAGKSTVALELEKQLQELFPKALIRISGFAHGVKKVATEAFGWDGKKDKKGRRLLQVVGTDAGRAYNPNIWAEMAYNDNVFDTVPPNILIFDDWRFPNEYEIWTDKPLIEKIYRIRVFRDSEVISDHISEKALPISPRTPDYYDYRFDNNGTKEELPKKAWQMLEEIL